MTHLIKKNLWFYIPYFIFFTFAGLILLLFKKTDIHLFINGIHCTPADFLFKYLTNVGDGVAVALFILILLFFSYRSTIALAFSTLFSTIVLLTLKEIIFKDVDRPLLAFTKLGQQLYLVPGVDVHTSYSFPSGHTISAFSVFLIFALLAKNNYLKLFFFICAFSIGYSRIYLSQHFLIDVFCGSLIGVFFSSISFLWLSNWKNNKLDLSLLYTLGIIKNDKQPKN